MSNDVVAINNKEPEYNKEELLQSKQLSYKQKRILDIMINDTELLTLKKAQEITNKQLNRKVD